MPNHGAVVPTREVGGQTDGYCGSGGIANFGRLKADRRAECPWRRGACRWEPRRRLLVEWKRRTRFREVDHRLRRFCKNRRVEGNPENRPDSRVAAVSREIVGVLKEAVGRGPTKARTYVHDDSVLVLLREGHTRSEGTMFEGGAKRAVAQGRVDLSEMIRAPLIEVIERNLGRKVAGFMSTSVQHPDLLGLVFVLDTSPLLELVDGEGAD